MKKTKTDCPDPANDPDLYSGLMRLHILCHAAERPIFGLGMVEELARHGYRISPGTPLLHGLEKKSYIRSTERRNGKSLRKMYQPTPPLGRRAVPAAKSRVSEFIEELFAGKIPAC
jgi:PadR family transcriptional regulator PadR